MLLHLINLLKKYVDFNMTYYRFIHPYLDGIDYYKLMKDLFIVIPYDIFICIMLM